MLILSMVEAQGSAPKAAVESVAAAKVVAAESTAVMWRFPHPDGQITQVPLWVMRTPGQFWLAAADGDDVFVEATGDAEAVSVTRGWTRDQLRVGDRQLALARKSTERIEALVTAFKADAGGPRHPAPVEAIVTGPLAEGAAGFPPWWVHSVPSEPEDPWLYAYVLATEWTFNVEGGTKTSPLVFGVRGRGLAVAAELGGQLHVAALEGPATAVAGLGRTRIEIGVYRLDGARLDGGRAAELTRMINADEGGRWAIAAALAMDDGRVDDAVSLWRVALARGHRAALSVHLAVAALAVDRPARAVTLLRSAEPEPGWMSKLTGWRRAAARRTDAVQALLDAEVEPASAPGPGWPWPPATPAEAWAAAGGPATMPEPPNDPRRLQIEAAIAEAKGPAPVAAAAYRVAARAWAGAQDPKAAYQALASALRLEPDSPDHFQAAVWAYAADANEAAGVHMRAGLKVSPSAESLLALEPSADVLRSAAEIARSVGLPQTAGRLLIAALERSSGATAETKLALARELAGGGAPAEAAGLIELVAAQRDDESEDGVEQLWLEAARLRHEAGAREETQTALRRAVQAGFLRPEVYREAAGFRSVVGDMSADWWGHLAHLLSGSPPPGRPRTPVDGLSKAQLDQLHPGGAGWLADMSQWLDAPAPPSRDQLIRGLERLESASFGPVFDVVDDVSRRLEIVPPPTYIYRGDDAYGLSAWPVSPPVLLIGHQHLVPGPRHLDGAALTFAVAVELVHLAAGHPLLSFESSVVGTSKSAYQAFGRFAGRAETVVDLVTLVPGIDQLAKIQRIVKLSRQVLTGWNQVNKASNLASPMLKWFGGETSGSTGGIGRERLEGAALQFRLQADRAALLLCGSASAAVEAVLKTSRKGVVKVDTARQRGLAPLLKGETDGLAPDELMRLSALLAWSAGHIDVNDVDPSRPGV